MTQPTRQQTSFAPLARQLLTSWKQGPSQLVVKREFLANPSIVAIAHGLCAHAHRVAEPALDLIERGLALEAMPLVRCVYECGVTAQWAVQVGDSSSAIVNEEIRQRRGLASTLQRASAQALRDEALGVERGDLDSLPSSSNASARNFEQLCHDLTPGGADAYAYYRVMSHLSHGSAMTVDRYVQVIDEDPGLRLRKEPDEDFLAWADFFIAVALAWAGRAVDFMDRDHCRRAELRAAARELGVTLDLRPSDAAWLRLNAQSGRNMSRGSD